MNENVGPFRTDLSVAAIGEPSRGYKIGSVTVDPDVMYSWLPSGVLNAIGISPVRTDQFQSPNGEVFERPIGFGMLFVDGRSTVTAFVFAEPDDRMLIGAHALSGLNLRIDDDGSKLVDKGPIIAAVAA